MSQHDYSRGSLAAMALGAVLISTSAVFVKWVGIGPTASAFWRMGLAAVLLLAWFARPNVRAGWKPTPRVFGLLVIAALFFAVDLWMWHRSILYVGVGLATLLGNFQVFVLAAYGAFVLGERGGWRLWAGLSMAVFGLALLLAPGWDGFDARFRIGIAFGLGTAVAYGGFPDCIPRRPGAAGAGIKRSAAVVDVRAQRLRAAGDDVAGWRSVAAAGRCATGARCWPTP